MGSRSIDRFKEPEVLNYMGKCYSSGMNNAEIAKAVGNKFGEVPSREQVQKIIDIFKTRKSDVVEGSHELQEMIKGTIIDTKSQLQRINGKCWDLLDKAEKEGTFEAVAVMKEILKQMEFQEKLLFRLQSNTFTPKINKLELTQVIINSLDDLEKQGVIKILKPNDVSKIGINSEDIIEVEVENTEEKKDASTNS